MTHCKTKPQKLRTTAYPSEDYLNVSKGSWYRWWLMTLFWAIWLFYDHPCHEGCVSWDMIQYVSRYLNHNTICITIQSHIHLNNISLNIIQMWYNMYHDTICITIWYVSRYNYVFMWNNTFLNIPQAEKQVKERQHVFTHPVYENNCLLSQQPETGTYNVLSFSSTTKQF